MAEDDKQTNDQQKKPLPEKAQKQPPHPDSKAHPEKKAGMSTDKASMKDEGYIQRIDEKTSKH